MYDVAIIGAGVTGCSVARELSRYRLSVVVLEKGSDVCVGTSKANSGIAHAGFDARPGSLMAKLNVEGSRVMEQLSQELDFPYKRNGSLVLCFREEDKPGLEKLMAQGIENGVEGLRIIDSEELHTLEPNVSPDACAALYAPTGGIVCPFGLTLAFAENAAVNGVEFLFNTPVENLEKTDAGYSITSGDRVLEAKCVVNAAGVRADIIHNMVCEEKIEIIPRKGEYMLMDRNVGNFVTRTVFQLPGKYGKGVLVTPTTHGNLIVGPNAQDIDDKDGIETTQSGLDEIRGKALISCPKLPMNQVITSFAGLRAHESRHDFRIEESAPGFIDCAAIESPGLTSAPAIGCYAAELVLKNVPAEKKDNFIATRKDILNPFKLPEEERSKLMKENPAYGTVICRCETVTEGQIVDAIRRPVGATTVDGIKRRTRAGMGRCQSGFCLPKTLEILARETGCSVEDITKNTPASPFIPEKEAK